MEKFASLLIMTRLKITPDRPEELVAVLQRRGEFNHETLGPESWPNACQLTVHGKVGPNETPEVALYRKTIEELGGEFITVAGNVCRPDGMVKIGQVEKSDKAIVHYAAIMVSSNSLKYIRLNASTGGLRLLRQGQVDTINNLFLEYHKDKGVPNNYRTCMFPDEIEALKNAFTIFGKQ